jgi:hypothetical protein
MKDATVDKVLSLIQGHSDQDDLEVLANACWHRAKSLREQEGNKVRRQVSEGDVVEIIGKIKPKYLKGAVGKVAKTSSTHCHIKVPTFGYRRFGGQVVGIPWTCIHKVTDKGELTDLEEELET